MTTGEPEERPHGELMIRALAMPADTNPAGDIFGGWVLSQMDIAGGVLGKRRCRGRCATVAVDAMKFLRPVHVGDVLCCYAAVEGVGRTSMTLFVEAWAIRQYDGVLEKVTEGTFTYVALDADGRKRAVDE